MSSRIFIMILVLFVFVSAQQQTKVDSLQHKLIELQNQVKKLTEKAEADEIQKLQQEAATFESQDAVAENKTFQSGQRSLQAINPEISVTGDAFGVSWLKNKPQDGFDGGMHFRVLGLHLQSNLDPFSLAKVALEFRGEEVELGEAYATWTNVIPRVSVTAGKFRQQFGVVNRWHAHSLDQFSFPLAMQTILGEDGLNQVGVSLGIMLPQLWAHSNVFTLEITNAQNNHIFNEGKSSFGSVLAHLKNYYDLSQSTYLEIGVTGVIGPNDGRDTWKSKSFSKIGGLDMTVVWEPINRAHYHAVTWRTELYYLDKKQNTAESVNVWGGYSYLDVKMSERINVGTRYDVTQPFIPDNEEKLVQQVVPYITWWQSHWVRWRVQYNAQFGNGVAQAPGGLFLQLTWAAGPHKHERY